MAKRTRHITLDDSWREKIGIGILMNRLTKAAHGQIEMTTQQIAAAKLVLSKVVPDLSASSVDLNAKVQLKNTPGMQKAALEELKRAAKKL